MQCGCTSLYNLGLIDCNWVIVCVRVLWSVAERCAEIYLCPLNSFMSEYLLLGSQLVASSYLPSLALPSPPA